MHDSAPGQPPYRFQTSATPEAIGWARAFAWSLASSLGVGQEVAADLKLVISELVSEVVRAQPDGPMTIHGSITDTQLTLRIFPWTDLEPEDRRLNAWDIATSLFELVRSTNSVVVFVDLGDT